MNFITIRPNKVCYHPYYHTMVNTSSFILKYLTNIRNNTECFDKILKNHYTFIFLYAYWSKFKKCLNLLNL